MKQLFDKFFLYAFPLHRLTFSVAWAPNKKKRIFPLHTCSECEFIKKFFVWIEKFGTLLMAVGWVCGLMAEFMAIFVPKIQTES